MGEFLKLTQTNGDSIWVRWDAVQGVYKQGTGAGLVIGGQEFKVNEPPELIMGGYGHAETEPGRKRVILRGQVHTSRNARGNGEAQRQTGRGNLPFDVARSGRAQEVKGIPRPTG